MRRAWLPRACDTCHGTGWRVVIMWLMRCDGLGCRHGWVY